MFAMLVSVVLEPVRSSEPSTSPVNPTAVSTSTSAVRGDLQGWLLPSQSSHQTASAVQPSLSVPLTVNVPAPVPAPSYVHTPSIMQRNPSMLTSIPVPSQTVQPSAMDWDEDSDSSDNASSDGMQHYNNIHPTPSVAYMNPIALHAQPPNTAHVPTKLQKKIQAGKYVDMGKQYRPDTPQSQEQIVAIKANGMLKVSSQPKSSEIYTFARFLDCFIVYMAIRGKSHPAEYPSMLKYLEIVKGLFNQGFDGVFYDKRFRMMRADNPLIPWSCYMAELLVRKANSESFNSHNTSNPSQTATMASNTNKKACHYFNSGKCSRSNCKFLHVCSVCNDKSHGKYQCFKK